MDNNTWKKYFNLAKMYFRHHNNLQIPYDFKTTNGYLYDEIGANLGKWLSNQKINFFDLTKERQELLVSIGFTLNAYEEKWLINYRLAKKYFEHHGNLRIPYDFKTINGYERDDTGTNLGTWLNTQKVTYATISKEKQDLLINIGFALSAYEEKWLINYRLAKKYFEYHGNLRIPKKYKTINGYEKSDTGINLGSWIVLQRTNYARLSKEKQDLLSSIGFTLNAHEEKWLINYGLAKKYYEHHGDLQIPYSFKTKNGYERDDAGTNLGTWLNTQRKNYINLSKEKQELLNKIGFGLEKKAKSWEYMYKLAGEYYSHHGNLKVPENFKTYNGQTYNINGFKLGIWLSIQKENYVNLTKEQQELLTKIGFNLDEQEETWEYMYHLAQKYYKYHENIIIPNDFKTSNGYLYDEFGSKLGIWLENQKRDYQNLSKERQKLLLSIGLVIEFPNSYWYKQYNIAKKYFEHYGCLFIPIEFKTMYGFDYNKDGFNLDVWLNKQIKSYSKLPIEKQVLLDAINMPKYSVEETWEYMYNLAKEYYRFHGNLEIPYSFKTKNGYLYDDTGIDLGIWLNIQILNYFRLTDEQQKLLKLIGFIPNSESIRWKRLYELTRIYYAYYGNLEIPKDFKTYDGYRYDEYGFNLGAWFDTQTRIYNELSEEQQTLLKTIGINIKENTLKLTRKL